MIYLSVTEEQRKYHERREKEELANVTESGDGDDWDDDHSTIGVGASRISIRRS